MGDIIKFIVAAITFYIIEKLVHDIHKTKVNENETDTNYSMTLPKAVIYFFSTMFILGMILFITFFIFKMIGNESITGGHLWFALIFSMIGAVIVAWGAKWKVLINDEEIEIQGIFHKNKKININEIEKAVIEKKQMNEEIGEAERVIIYKNGKKVVAVENSALNYSRFINTLKSYGKLAN